MNKIQPKGPSEIFPLLLSRRQKLRLHSLRDRHLAWKVILREGKYHEM
jgi:hypothetical protein